MFVARDAKGKLVNALEKDVTKQAILVQPVEADYDYDKDRGFERTLPMKG